MPKLKKSKSKKVKKIKKSKEDLEEERVRKRQLCSSAFIIAAVFLFVCFVFTKWVGPIGEVVKNIFFSCFGGGSYCIPVILAYFGLLLKFKQSVVLYFRLDIIYSVTLVFVASVLVNLFNINDGAYCGGFIGLKFSKLIVPNIAKEQFTKVILSIIALFLILHILRLSMVELIKGIFKELKEKNELRKALKQQEKVYNETKEQKSPKIIKEDKKQEELKEEEPPKPNIINKAKEEPVKIKEKENKKENNQLPEPGQEPQPQVAAVQQEPAEQKEKIDSTKIKYILPALDLLKDTGATSTVLTDEQLQERAQKLRETLVAFNIDAVVKDIIPGPVITRYDIILKPGVKIQSVTNISENISLAMQTSAIRIEPIPEKSAVGIEIPNPKAAIVGLRSILKGDEFKNSQSLLTIGLGTTTEGKGYVANLAKMPHLLIAGSTGSGKSVGIHSVIVSILYKARPDEVKFMLIDPKRVEMTLYKDIPHLYNPCCIADKASVITRPQDASDALKKLVGVMEERYDKYASNMVRNIEEYNAKMAETAGEKDYYIVVIIDELADLMLVASKEIEDSIQRLAQMSRAVGIHLILATQRPSVNVITGVIKANFPARLSFQTTSAIDSKVILDTVGAEELIGKGDMLYLSPSSARPVRLQGAFVSTGEVEKIVEFIYDQGFPKIYDISSVSVSASSCPSYEDKEMKDLIPALQLILERKKVSHDLLKMRLGGSARASNIMSILEMKEFIYKPEGTNRWQVRLDLIEDYLKNNELNS